MGQNIDFGQLGQPSSTLPGGAGPPPRSRRYFPPLYQKHERGADLCVWLEEFLEKQILGFLSFLDFTTILLGIYQDTRHS